MLRLLKKTGQQNSNNKHIQFWQQNNQPIEIYNHERMLQKLNYTHQNPVVLEQKTMFIAVRKII